MLNSMMATRETWTKSVIGLKGVFGFRFGTMVRMLSLNPPMV